jgi:hypothetical protein
MAERHGAAPEDTRLGWMREALHHRPSPRHYINGLNSRLVANAPSPE